jgi:hypothetical protein
MPLVPQANTGYRGIRSVAGRLVRASSWLAFDFGFFVAERDRL